MSTYNEFRKLRRIELLDEHPEYSRKTIQHIISDEWKKKKGAGANITARKTTMQYECFKTLINRVPKFDFSKNEDICNIVNSNSCSYCPVVLPRKSVGDHFMPVAGNSKAPILCNFSHLTIPCCQKCNSSKANKSWQEFADSNETSIDKRKKLQLLQDFIDKHIKYYAADQTEVDNILQKIQEFLRDLRHDAELISITEIENEFVGA
jgi:hypothetical protein